MSEQINNRGIMFPNFGKKKPQHPDFTGSALIGGVNYKISGWEKQGRRTKFYSMAFTPAAAAATALRPQGETELSAEQSGPESGPTADNVPW